MKKSNKFLLTVLLAVGLWPTFTLAFSDVTETDSEFKYVNYFYEQGVISGYPDGTFRPEKVLNRAEQLKVFLLLSGVSPDASFYKNCFSDVKEEWFAKYVCYAKSKQIVQGFPDGKFYPSREVNKVESLKMLAEIEKWNFTDKTSPSFDDTPLAEWFSKYVEAAVDLGIIEKSTPLFGPALGISRGDTMELMFKSLAFYKLGKTYSVQLDQEILAINLDLAVFSNSSETTDVQNFPLLINNISSLPENGQAKAGGFYDFEFELIDNAGNKITGADLEVYLTRPFQGLLPGESERKIIGYREENGKYFLQIVSKVAGKNNLVIRNKTTGQVHVETFEFRPDSPYQLTVLNQSGPGGNSLKLSEKIFSVMLADRFGNKIENAEFSANTISGNAKVFVQKNYNGTAEIEVLAEQFGPVSLEISAYAAGVERNLIQNIDFIPNGFGNFAAYKVGPDFINIPLLLYLPDQTSGLDQINYKLEIDGSLNVVDFDLNGVLNAEVLSPVKNEFGNWEIEIFGYPDFSGGYDGKIGDIKISGIPEGQFDLNSEINLQFNTPDFKEYLYRNGGRVQNAENNLYVPMQRPLAQINGKPEKRICVDALIQPGANVTNEMVNSDMKQAEDIFYRNAQNCNCSHFLKIDFSTYTFPAADWTQITGGDQYLGALDYVDFIKNRSPITPRPWCTKLFYINNQSDSEIGISIRTAETDELPGVGSFIKLDNARDADGRSFAHELAHHLSGNMIEDPDDAGGAAQGAGRQGNLMSYDEMDEDGSITEHVTGDDLTRDQCALINWDHSRFSHYPPR